MVSDELRSLLENMRDQQMKVKIRTFTRLYQVGFVSEVHDDFLTLKGSKNTEGFDSVIMLCSIAVIETRFFFK